MTADTSRAALAITHRRVLNIAVPIMLSNITVPLLGLVDTGVVGQLGEAAPIGAVAIGAVILTTVYWAFGFLRMGTTGLTAQAVGAGDRAETVALLTRVVMIGLIAGTLLISLQVFIFAGAFRISPATEAVEGLAREYVQIRIWSAPAAIAIYGINGWLIAREQTQSVLALQIWINGLNIALDLLFVLQLGWGVEGVAWATFIAEWTGLGFGLWLCRSAFRDPNWRSLERIFHAATLWRMAAVNSDIMVRSVLLTAGFTLFVMLSPRFGEASLAANHILLQFLELTAFGLDGFALAAETLVGQAMGRRNLADFRRGAVMTSIWGAGLCLCLMLVFAIFGGAIVDVMTTAEDVRDVAREFLPWMVLAPLIGGPSWMLDGIFIGATRTRDMRNMMVLSVLGYLAALAVFMPLWGNHGLWAAMMVFFGLRGITLGFRYPALERTVGEG